MKAALVALLLISAACAGVPPQPDPGRKCDAGPAQRLVGRPSADVTDGEALRLSGARTLRRIPKGGMVTMDYSEHRLNLQLDEKGRIVRASCG